MSTSKPPLIPRDSYFTNDPMIPESSAPLSANSSFQYQQSGILNGRVDVKAGTRFRQTFVIWLAPEVALKSGSQHDVVLEISDDSGPVFVKALQLLAE